MDRFGDKGHYEVGNVRICTTEENHAEQVFSPPKTRAKLFWRRAALVARNKTPEMRAKVSAALKGRKHTPEHCAKISAANKGRAVSVSAETSAKLSAANRRRGPPSLETRAKISAGVRASQAVARVTKSLEV